MKRTPLKRGSKTLKRSGFSKTPTTKTKRAISRRLGANKGKVKSVSTLRNSCDKLLTPIIKKLYPRCLLCGNETQVAHHHIKKSTSSALRYYIPNLIPLCNKCHLRLHCDEILWTGRIIVIKGLDWLADLEEKKNQLVKTNSGWYQEHLERLKGLL